MASNHPGTLQPDRPWTQDEMVYQGYTGPMEDASARPGRPSLLPTAATSAGTLAPMTANLPAPTATQTYAPEATVSSTAGAAGYYG